MRIGIITGEYPPLQGGVGAFTEILARNLYQLGHQVFVLSDSRARTLSENIAVTAKISWWNLQSLPIIRQWIQDNRIDIVNLQFQTAAYGMSPWIHFLPHILQVPLITTFHDLRFPYLFPKAGGLRNWIVMHLAQTSAGIITTNYEDDIRVQHIPQRTVIPIGSNILAGIPASYDRSYWRQSAHIGDDDFLIAYFGFINHTKGVETLLHALNLLDGNRFRLVIIGDRTGTADYTNEKTAHTIEKLIEDLHLAARIFWTGYIPEDEVAAWLHAANVVALPFRDGASLRRGSLLAAIQYGCPVITTLPAISSPLLNDEYMILIPPDDPQPLAQKIQDLADHPAQAERLRNNIQHLKKYFDWEQIALQTAAFFARILGSESL